MDLSNTVFQAGCPADATILKRNKLSREAKNQILLLCLCHKGRRPSSPSHHIFFNKFFFVKVILRDAKDMTSCDASSFTKGLVDTAAATLAPTYCIKDHQFLWHQKSLNRMSTNTSSVSSHAANLCLKHCFQHRLVFPQNFPHNLIL